MKLLTLILASILLLNSPSSEARRLYQGEGAFLLYLVKDRYGPMKLAPEEICILVKQLTGMDVFPKDNPDGSVTYWLEEWEDGRQVSLSTLHIQYYVGGERPKMWTTFSAD